MADMEALWASHDRRIREVLARLGDAITSDIRDEVDHLLKNREYGIAFEGLSSHINDRAIDVDPTTQRLLAEIEADMGDDLP